MGKKKTEESPKVEEVKDEEEEDTPIVKTLKEIDVRYCKIETEYEQEVEKLRKKFFDEKQAAVLEERAKILAATADAPAEDHEFGTPACKGFWLQAMQNCEEFAEILEEWDDPVLQYMTDLKSTDLDNAMPQKGYKLEFFFKENPYFTNTSLVVEFHMNYNPETHQPWKALEIVETKASAIEWKPGKDVTVAVVAKKVKGGGAKKAKQKGKEKQEDRPSFFRVFFRNLKSGDELPEDLLNMMTGGEEVELDEEEAEEVFTAFMGQCIDPIRQACKDCLIPYAIRYYTGEIEQMEDDSDEESEEEDSDEDEDDSDSEDEAPKGKNAKKKPQNKKGSPALGPKDGKKEEECKQQ